MSGPKISVYSLTQRQREILSGIMHCRQNVISCSTKTQNVLKDLVGLLDRLDGEIKNYKLLVKRAPENEEKLQELLTLQCFAKEEIDQITIEAEKQAKLKTENYKLKEEDLVAWQNRKAESETLLSRAEDIKTRIENALHSDEDITERIRADILKDLSEPLSFDFEADEQKPEVEDTDFLSEKESVQGILTDMLAENELALSDPLREEIQQASVFLQRISSRQHLTNFHAVTVRRLQKSLEEILMRQQEQAYIRECVDEVMAEMGYELLGEREVRKKSGKQFQNEIFSFHEGTAVNVTYSPDGQIAMELGGLAREDRTPTEEETKVLTSEMESFCGEFAEFEKRMLERGVVVGKRIALSPPSAEYAAIINVNDYNIDSRAQVAEMDISRKRRAPVERKVMRRGE